MLQEKLLEADRTTAGINSLEIVAAESSLVSPASGNTAVLTKLVETELTVIDGLNLDAGNNNSFSTATSSSQPTVLSMTLQESMYRKYLSLFLIRDSTRRRNLCRFYAINQSFSQESMLSMENAIFQVQNHLTT